MLDGDRVRLDRRRFSGRRGSEGRGLALVALSVVERRLDAVRTVLARASVREVAGALETWRSHRPRSSPLQVEPAVEARGGAAPGSSEMGSDGDPFSGQPSPTTA